MAKEEELKRVDLKVNVSCCEGCRRKVMRAMSLKGVLRTEIHPSMERVTVVGNVDAQVLVRKLAKVGKIAEPVSAAALPSEQPKRRDSDGGSGGNVDKPALALGPAPAGEKSKRKDDDGCKVDTGAVASNKKECSKCAHQQGKRKDDDADGRGKKAASKDLEEGDGFAGAGKGKPSSPEHEASAAQQQQPYYHRAEPPSMAVPVQHVPYYAAANVAAPSYYGGGGYYAMPPPAPMMAMPSRPDHLQQQQQQQLRPQQPSRFDVDYFNDDNAVGCHVM